MLIKLCGLTIVVRCVNIEQKEIFILDFSFYADVSSHGINNLSLYFTIKAVAQQKSSTSCTATPMGKFYWSAPFSFPLFFFICCRMRYLKKYNTRCLLPAPCKYCSPLLSHLAGISIILAVCFLHHVNIARLFKVT